MKALAELVAEYYATGNERALDRVFTSGRTMLLRYSQASLAIKCEQAREDLVQDSLIHVLEVLRARGYIAVCPETGAVQNFAAWLYRVHYNRFVNTIRAKKEASKPGALEDAIEMLPASRVRQASESDVADEKQAALSLLLRLTQQVAALPAPQRECFRLYYYEGVPYKQIGEQLGCSEATAKTRVFHARNALHEWAAKKLGQPTEAIYEAFALMDNSALFGEGPAHKRAAAGFFTSKKRQGLRYRKASQPAPPL